MYRLGTRSRQKLDECHPIFKVILEDLIQYIDFSIIEGHRGREAQELAYSKGLSQLHFGFSKHNSQPSDAIHVVPYPIDWGELSLLELYEGVKRGDISLDEFVEKLHKWRVAYGRFAFLAGQIIATGRKYGAIIRWGGDWDSDGELRNNNWNDLGHYELLEIKKEDS